MKANKNQNRYVLMISFKVYHNGTFKPVKQIKEFFKSFKQAKKALDQLIDDSVKELVIYDRVTNQEKFKQVF